MAMQAFNQMDPNESVSSSASPMSSPENQHMKSGMKNAFNQIVDPNESGISSASPMNSPENQHMKSDKKNASNQSNIDPNESGYCSANDQSPMSSRVIESKEEDSLSTPMKKPKLEEFNEELSHYENWKTESRPIKISFRNVDYNWETSSEESIGDWVKRNISEAIKKSRVPNMDQLILRNSHGSVINLGWKTCILNEEENYKCEFRPNNNHKMKSELCRKDFPDLIDFSEVKCFTVESKLFPACYLKKIQNIRCLQVNFVPGESLYEALYRDGRFDKVKIRSYDLQFAEIIETQKRDTFVPLSASADHYAGKYFEFSKRTVSNDTLQVQPYHKEHCGKPVDRAAIKSEQGPTLAYHVKAGTSGNIKEDTCKEQFQEGQHHKIIATKITCDQELLDFIGDVMLKVNLVSENKKEVTKELNKYFKANFNNYALNENLHLYTADHEFIVKVCHSVGAVAVKYTSGEEDFIGTCFRIGTLFVLTNMHVVVLINQKSSLLQNVFIDFDHGEPRITHREFLCDRDQYSAEGKFVPVVSSTELDYAVLKLVPIDVPLPPSLTGMFGLPICNQHLQEGTFLTFVGHPNGDKTATNLLCPIRNPENLDENIAILLSQRDREWLNDKKVETYDVSTFLNGASGSPGFLLRERGLAVMHTRGAILDQSNGRTVEQGVMMSVIMSDVWYKIKSGLLHYQFQDLFDIERPQWTISS